MNDAQTEQLRALLSTREMELERFRTAGAKGRKGDARAVQEQFRSSLRGILTPSQAEIFDRGIGRKK